MRSLKEKNCAVLITKHQSPKVFQHFLLLLLVMLLKISQVPLSKISRNRTVLRCCVSPTTKVFKIKKKFADTFCFLSIKKCSDQISRKIIKSTCPINSLERQPVILDLTASDGLCRLWKTKVKTKFYRIPHFITFLLTYSLWGFH